MSKVTMPEPVAAIAPAYVLFWASGDTLTRICERTGAKVGSLLITTTQAEAYADARVREALDAAAKICDDRAMRNEAAVSADEPDEASSLRAAAWQMGVCARDIRALIK